ncbi:hypothetical protein Hanom_Chr10g00904971 [Helianthus anomalus]
MACEEGSEADWEGYAGSFDYDEGSDVLNRTRDDIVENPNGSASATAGMIKAQVGAVFNYFVMCALFLSMLSLKHSLTFKIVPLV